MAESPNEKLRLFCAVTLGEPVASKAAEAAARAHKLAKDAKWAKAEGFHLTLFFFGWVDAERLPELESALAGAAMGQPAMRLGVRGSGTFGSSKKPRVLWLGLTGDLEPLSTLQARVSEAVSRFGFTPESRPFAPHLTLARARDPRGDPALAKCREALGELDCGECEVAALELYRSELSPKGSHYTLLSSWPLQPRKIGSP